MARLGVRFGSFTFALGLIACAGGCGQGLLGFDDVQPGACALGPTSAYQPQVLPSKDAVARLKIYLLRGLDNVYSLGLDNLATEMHALNLSATMVDWPNWVDTARQIASEYGGPEDDTQYVLIGHSYGADDAVRTALYMKDYGMQVKMLFLLDATDPDPIPDNVDTCIHYYEPWLPGDLLPDIFSGNPVVADLGNTRTHIENLLFTQEALGDGVGCADHFSIDANQLMHNIILTDVLHLMAGRADDTGSKIPE
jgi:pimeloyl-ACP methyl ester carboxylesterase